MPWVSGSSCTNRVTSGLIIQLRIFLNLLMMKKNLMCLTMKLSVSMFGIRILVERKLMVNLKIYSHYQTVLMGLQKRKRFGVVNLLRQGTTFQYGKR